MQRSLHMLTDRIAWSLALLFTLDRLLKMAVVQHFFRRPPLPDPPTWPSITLLQPLTRGASGLASNLHSRLTLNYPGPLQHLLVCDAHDEEIQQLCRQQLAEHTLRSAELIVVQGEHTHLATKIEKLNAALPAATGEILFCIDDDIALRPDALHLLIRHLRRPGVGVVFGLACYTNWETPWSSLMSLFVNDNALLSYIPLSYLTEPYTVTGHCFALPLTVLRQVGAWEKMEGRVDDDHEIARRIRQVGLRCVQTPLIYDVNNELSSWRAYRQQMKRWFVLPRQTMLPALNAKEKGLTLLTSIGNLFPALLLLLALLSGRGSTWRSLGSSLALSAALHAYYDQHYLQRRTPLRRWLLFPLVALLTPLQIVAALFANDEIEWRGQRLIISRTGKVQQRL